MLDIGGRRLRICGDLGVPHGSDTRGVDLGDLRDRHLIGIRRDVPGLRAGNPLGRRGFHRALGRLPQFLGGDHIEGGVVEGFVEGLPAPVGISTSEWAPQPYSVCTTRPSAPIALAQTPNAARRAPASGR